MNIPGECKTASTVSQNTWLRVELSAARVVGVRKLYRVKVPEDLRLTSFVLSACF